MSALINSLLIEPALRQARRFSITRELPPQTRSISHATNDGQVIPTNHSPDSALHTVQPATLDANNWEARESSAPGQLSLGDLRERYNCRGEDEEAEATPPSRIATVARENGLQGLLPLDDVRSNYIFDQDVVSSPMTEPEPAGVESALAAASRNFQHAEARTLDSLSSMSIDDGPSMTSNPSYGVPADMRSVGHGSVSSSRRGQGSLGSTQTEEERARMSVSMLGNLPEDDGMKRLRQQMHQIREMALSSEEKARRMHELMTADYQRFRLGQDSGGLMSEMPDGKASGHDHHHSPKPSVSNPGHKSDPSTGSVLDDPPFASSEELAPTYQPRHIASEVADFVEDEVSDEEELSLGCAHYRRNVKVQCGDCRKWYTCRHCHDEAQQGHKLDRTKIKYMLCMLCRHAQLAGEYCNHCGELAAAHYCDICKLWDNDPSHSIYHCSDCGICRRGQGLGKDYIHCKRCNVCISIKYAETHRCVERATECDCPICGEWMFTSSRTVVAVRCGHYMHKTCFEALMQTSFKCPICNRSAVNMELQWRKLDHAIEAQPMPGQFKQTKVYISCNDCLARSTTNFHWLGNRCTMCDSYNTNQIKMINSPSEQELQSMHESRDVQIPTLGDAGQEPQMPIAVEQSQIAADAQARQNIAESGRFAHAAVRVASQPSETSAEEPAPLPVEIQRQLGPEGQDWHTRQQQETRPRASSQRSPNYFFPDSPRSGGNDAAETTEQSSGKSEGGSDDMIPDDVAFCALGPAGQKMTRAARLTTSIGGAGVSRSSWNMPSVPSVSMPSMPGLPEGWPRMPSISIPSVGVPRAVSPSALWAAGSPSVSGWSLPSPSFFAARRLSVVGSEAMALGNEGAAVDIVESEGSSVESGDEDERMDVEGEEDGGDDDMELFGHR